MKNKDFPLGERKEEEKKGEKKGEKKENSP